MPPLSRPVVASRPDDLRHQRSYFEQLDGAYADGYAISVPFLERIRAALSPHIGGRVLDIGNGGLATWQLERAASITFADLCTGALRAPKTVEAGAIRPLRPAERARVRSVGANALALPFPKGTFDVAVMSYVAHHLSVGSRRGSQRNIGRAFAEVHRVLRPGGAFLLLENHPAWPFKAAQDAGFGLWFRLLMRFGKPLPYFLSRRQARRLLGRDRFQVVGSQRIAWCPRVHQPLFPRWTPPGWLWERVLTNRLLVLRRGGTPQTTTPRCSEQVSVRLP